jgi:hypothetical protein
MNEQEQRTNRSDPLPNTILSLTSSNQEPIQKTSGHVFSFVSVPFILTAFNAANINHRPKQYLKSQRRDAMQSGRTSPTFQRNPLPPSSTFKTSEGSSETMVTLLPRRKQENAPKRWFTFYHTARWNTPETVISTMTAYLIKQLATQ